MHTLHIVGWNETIFSVTETIKSIDTTRIQEVRIAFISFRLSPSYLGASPLNDLDIF